MFKDVRKSDQYFVANPDHASQLSKLLEKSIQTNFCMHICICIYMYVYVYMFILLSKLDFANCWSLEPRIECQKLKPSVLIAHIMDSIVSSYKLHYTYILQLCAHKVMGTNPSESSEILTIILSNLTSKWQFVYVCLFKGDPRSLCPKNIMSVILVSTS